MTEEYNENIDSQNDADEVGTSEVEQTNTEDSNELTDREKQFLARAKKAESKLKEVKSTFEEKKPEEVKKINTEQNAPTIEHMAILARDQNIEKLKLAEDYAKLKGISLTEAYESPVMKAEFREMDEKAKIKANSIPASSGSAPTPRQKTISNMDENEHRNLWQEKIKSMLG